MRRSEAVGKNSAAYGLWGDGQRIVDFLFNHKNHALQYVDEHSDLYESAKKEE